MTELYKYNEQIQWHENKLEEPETEENELNDTHTMVDTVKKDE